MSNRAPRRFDAPRVFYIACIEVYRSGVAELAELLLLERLEEQLEMDGRLAVQLACLASRRAPRLEGRRRAFSRNRLYMEASRQARKGGHPGEKSMRLLDVLAEVLGLSVRETLALDRKIPPPAPPRPVASSRSRRLKAVGAL